jgi:hypothetical protein
VAAAGIAQKVTAAATRADRVRPRPDEGTRTFEELAGSWVSLHIGGTSLARPVGGLKRLLRASRS